MERFGGKFLFHLFFTSILSDDEEFPLVEMSRRDGCREFAFKVGSDGNLETLQISD